MTDKLRAALERIAKGQYDGLEVSHYSASASRQIARAALAAAPQPAPMDREALVEVIDAHVFNALGETSAEAIADALLARGLCLPGADAEAERDAAFAAGQAEMRERAAKAAEMAFHTGAGENDLLAAHNGGIIMAQNHIRALPIKPRP